MSFEVAKQSFCFGGAELYDALPQKLWLINDFDQFWFNVNASLS